MKSTKFTLIFMMAGLFAILATAVYYHFDLGSLANTKVTANSNGGTSNLVVMEDGTEMQMPPQGMGGGSDNPMMNMSALFNKADVDPEMATRAGELMQKMQADPQNPEVLIELSLLFFEAEDYLAMLNFANRASALSPTSAKAAYLSGIAHSQLGEPAEAAAAFERSLALEENAATRYSLAIIYIYSLNDKEKGKAHLDTALTLPSLDDSLKSAIEKELAGM